MASGPALCAMAAGAKIWEQWPKQKRHKHRGRHQHTGRRRHTESDTMGGAEQTEGDLSDINDAWVDEDFDTFVLPAQEGRP